MTETVMGTIEMNIAKQILAAMRQLQKRDRQVTCFSAKAIFEASPEHLQFPVVLRILKKMIPFGWVSDTATGYSLTQMGMKVDIEETELT